MPRYYFHLRNCPDCIDEEGRELSDATAAYAAAVMEARSILSEDVLQGKLPLGGSIEVKDERGNIVLTLPFRSAIRISE